MRVVAALATIAATTLVALALQSVRVVVGHRTCTFGYDGCDELHGQPAWADVATALVAVVGLALAALLLARRPARRGELLDRGRSDGSTAPRGRF